MCGKRKKPSWPGWCAPSHPCKTEAVDTAALAPRSAAAEAAAEARRPAIYRHWTCNAQLWRLLPCLRIYPKHCQLCTPCSLAACSASCSLPALSLSTSRALSATSSLAARSPSCSLAARSPSCRACSRRRSATLSGYSLSTRSLRRLQTAACACSASVCQKTLRRSLTHSDSLHEGTA